MPLDHLYEMPRQELVSYASRLEWELDCFLEIIETYYEDCKPIPYEDYEEIRKHIRKLLKKRRYEPETDQSTQSDKE